MKFPKAYTLQFMGLADGKHRLEYELDERFLAHYEASLVQKAKVQVVMDLEKSPGLLQLHLHLSGTVETTCDLCGEEFDLPVEREEDLIVKLVSQVPEMVAEDSEVMYLENTASSLSLADFFYEALTLSIPTRKVHPEDAQGQPSCDPEVLRRWQQYLAPEEPAKEEKSIWDELKKLKN